MKDTRIAESDRFHLDRRVTRKGRVSYEITMHNWLFDMEETTHVRKFFDPKYNDAVHSGLRRQSWKFSNRKDAEQKYILALMKFN